MHWREGFRRVARASAVAYWGLAVVCLGFYGYSQGAVSPREMTVEAYGRAFRLYAQDDAEAAALLKAYLDERPELKEPASNAFDRYDTPAFIGYGATRRDWTEVARRSLAAVPYWLGIYVALWALFRGVRWVGRGFLDGASAGASDASSS